MTWGTSQLYKREKTKPITKNSCLDVSMFISHKTNKYSPQKDLIRSHFGHLDLTVFSFPDSGKTNFLLSYSFGGLGFSPHKSRRRDRKEKLYPWSREDFVSQDPGHHVLSLMPALGRGPAGGGGQPPAGHRAPDDHSHWKLQTDSRSSDHQIGKSPPRLPCYHSTDVF